MNEIWMPIPGYAHYEVSSVGRVRSVRHQTQLGPRGGKIRSLQIDSHGYAFLVLYHGEHCKNERVHRLVGLAFIPNPLNKPQINHLNGVRSDNRIENLEWATNSENNLHAFQELGRECPGSSLGKFGALHHRAKAVVAVSISDGSSTQFESLSCAERAGFSKACVWMACNGKIKTHAGNTWSYL